MPNPPYDAAHLAALGRDWIAAWNSRDLERVLSLYAEDAEMTSEHIPALGIERLLEHCAKAPARPAFRADRSVRQSGQRDCVLSKPARHEDLRISSLECGRPDQAGLGQSPRSAGLNHTYATQDFWR